MKAFGRQEVSHETAIRAAFQNLLAETAKPLKWTLVPELSMKVKGKLIRPDGTLRDDEWLLPRGYWEAKNSYGIGDIARIEHNLDDEVSLYSKALDIGMPATRFARVVTQEA